MENNPMPVILYVRVNKFEYDESEEKLKADLERLKKHCKNKKYKILKVFKECYPAKAFDSPEWYRLRDYVEETFCDAKTILITNWATLGVTLEDLIREVAHFTLNGGKIDTVDSPVDYYI